MNQKKNKKIIILIVGIIVLILGVGLAYTYFATDVFNSNKQMFFKYLAQTSDEKKGFVNNDVIKYFEKRKNTPYETNGQISFEIQSSNNEEIIENTNKCNITIKGKVDNANQKINQEINVNYAEDVKFPILYQKIGDLVGLQTDYVGSKYIGADKSKLGEVLNTNNSENSNLEDLQISEEQIKHIKDTYYKVLDEQLHDNNFTTIRDGKKIAYQLNLSEEDLRNILVKILETLKNDQSTLEKLNEYLKMQNQLPEITTENIDEMIEELNSIQEFKDTNLQITVHVENKKLSKVEIAINNYLKVIIEKLENGNSKQYNMSAEVNIDDESIKVYLNAKYSGLQSLQTINEDYELGFITGSENYIYYYNNEVNFVDNVEIQDFNEDNILVLSDYNNEQVENLMSAVVNRLGEVNKQLMERLGLTETQNPLIYCIPLVGSINQTANNVINNSSDTLGDMYNKTFEQYEGNNIRGATVNGLLQTILANNYSYEDDDSHIIKQINFNGEEFEVTEENITLIRSEVNVGETYSVECEKDENTGLVNRIVINKN